MAGEKLTQGEVENRVSDCFKKRYVENYRQHQWIKYCHETYGDKSEKQYTQYWLKAKDRYDNGWREKLNKLLDPAVNELSSLLASEDERIRSRAVDQVIKYTGNEETKIAVEGGLDIKLTWGDNEAGV
tara:strand:+ start:5134 stop:5517 length:384 start_codon:yes stop_codon:yes gene_type:complete